MATMTPDQLADRTRRAVDAAVAAGCQRGIDVSEPRVLHDVFSVVVHLAPSSVVARIPTVLVPHSELHEVQKRQRTEIDVVSRLAEQGHPVVPLSALLPREPVAHDGFSMTFWEFVEHRTEAEPDFVRTSAVSADLHLALRDYPGELEFLSCVDPSIPRVEDVLVARPDLLAPQDLDRARREWEILAPVVGSRAGFEAEFPGVEVQPIHGDSPPFNIVSTERGELYADLELASLGPVEWDMTLAGPECEAAYDEAARRNGLRPLDSRVQRVMDAARRLQLVACLSMTPQLPMLGEGLAPAIAEWRESPLAGGLG